MIRLIPGATLLVELIQLAVSVLAVMVLLSRVGVDVIGRVRRTLGLDGPGGDRA